ncbi:MAG: hypothetical protein NWS93_01255, partial [Schleiferiaceae bacterium]|nr:hypothetical protein [Schleiferiaceae bacterium]
MQKLTAALCVLCLVTAQAQTISVLNPILDDAVRRAQLWGDVPLTSSMCIRPLHADRVLGIKDPFGQDSIYDFIQAGGVDKPLNLKIQDKRGLFKLQMVPINVKFQYNSHHDHGWQDGPMVPNRGAQVFASGGVYLRLAKFIEAQFAPEVVYAQNRAVPNGWNPPVR